MCVLVLVALPEAGFEPLQPRLALLRRAGEAQGSHLAGYDGEKVSRSVPSQVLLHFVGAPNVDEGQGLHVCPRHASSSYHDESRWMKTTG